MRLTYEQITKVQDRLCPYVRTPTENYKGICAFGFRCSNCLQDFKECRNYKIGIERKV